MKVLTVCNYYIFLIVKSIYFFEQLVFSKSFICNNKNYVIIYIVINNLLNRLTYFIFCNKQRTPSFPGIFKTLFYCLQV